MRSISIYIEMENAAFEPDSRQEAARILRRVASDIESGKKPLIRDINGNTVGHIEMKGDMGYAN